MKIFLIICCGVLINHVSIIGQCTHQHTFGSQEQINLFPVFYPDCDSITSLVISGTDIIDLTPLISIKEVSDGVIIRNNPLLSNLKGLDSLKHGGYAFNIDNNLALVSLEGLSSLEVVDEYLIIAYNPRLKNLIGLENLSSVKDLHIAENDSLKNLDGLESIKEGVAVNLVKNPSLQNVRGLQNFEWGYLSIEDNDALINLDGLEKVHTLSALLIYENENLTDISALKSLEKVWSDANVFLNPSLTQCAIYYFCQSPFDPGSIIYIADNGVSCNSLNEILDVCHLSNSYAKGSVYLDFNCNQVFDDSDVFLPQHILESVESHLPIAATTQTGEFATYLLDDDTLKIHPRELQGFTYFPVSYQIITDTTFQVFDSIDFAFCPDTLFHDLGVTLTGYNVPRPGFTNRYQVCVQNKGTFIDGGNLVFDFSNTPGSEYITILNADSPGIINGTTVTWTIDTIPVFMNLCFDVEIMPDVSTPLGTILLPHVIVNPIEPVTEIDLSNNEITISQTVVGSYDPNDKSVNLNQINFSNEATPLEYVIRFQNTGTFPATFIEVIDTLEHELDIRSFEMIASSHPYTLTFPDTNIIIWRFDNINLPDSTVNEAESHGFIHFRINTRPNLALNTEVRNKAAIYFDFNDPVITNATSTIIESPVKTEEYLDIKYSASITPNPNEGEFYLKLILREATTIDLGIFNSHGHPVYSELNKHLDKGNHNILMKPHSMNAGIYFLRILTPQGLTTKKILVVR